MTPKNKAAKLRYLIAEKLELDTKDIKVLNCALITIEFSREFITGDLNESFDKTMYLFDVKQEIEKLCVQ